MYKTGLPRAVALTLTLVLAACCHLGDQKKPDSDSNATRAQLSIGYSLLYSEVEGIPKLKWILLFKDEEADMGRVTHELVGYYEQLGHSMEKLSKEHPSMRIDVVAMSPIESKERKTIGLDLAKDLAPVVGKTGIPFEREALLNLYTVLNEQRHLVGVMLDLETEPTLRRFLETTKSGLETQYEKVGALLNRRYFVQ